MKSTFSKATIANICKKLIALAVAFVLALQLMPEASAASSIKLKSYNYPVKLSVGASYSVRGVVSSAAKVTGVTVGVYTKASGGTCKTGRSVAPNARSYNVSKLAKYVKFSKLKKGTYYYRITISTTTLKKKVILNKKFTVK